MNKNPERPKEIDELMFEVFGTKKKKKVLPLHKQISNEISDMVKEIKR